MAVFHLLPFSGTITDHLSNYCSFPFFQWKLQRWLPFCTALPIAGMV